MIRLEVPGPPRGKNRPRFNRATGRTYTDQRTVSAEERVRGAWHRAGEPRVDGPLAMRVEIVVGRPGSHFKLDGSLSAAGARALWPTKKPDLDNVLKLCADSLNGCAYRDDVQIVLATVTRRWCRGDELERTVITIDQAPAGSIDLNSREEIHV